MKSIISNEKKCWICGKTYDLDKHHIYGAGNRNISERNGFWIYLCKEHHNMSDNSVHFNAKMRHKIQKFCQIKYESLGHTRQEFMNLIGENFIR